MPSPAWRSLVLLAALSSSAAAAPWRAEGPDAANVNRLAIAPSRPDTVYVATSGGGVWRSDDGGDTWTLPGDEMTSRDVRWIAVDPADPNAVWAGLEASGEGSALWRSRDGGARWTRVDDDYPGGSVHATGAPIAFAPAQPPAKGPTIYVASSNLHYRTDDGGRTWRDFRVPNQDAYVFAVHPTDPKIVFAGGRGETQNVSRSTDGGKTWRQIGIGLGKTSLYRLFFDPARPTTLYAAGGTFATVFKSTDQGERWSALELPVGGTSELHDLTIDPAGRLWAATESGLLVSSDGGASWTRSDAGTGRYWVKSIAADPRDPKRLLAGAGGDGVFRSTDGGARWSPSSRGLAAGWVERLWGSESGSTVFAKLATGLYRHDGAGWSEVTAFGEGGEADVDGFLFDAASPQTVYAFDGAKQWRSGDGGRSWQEVAQKELSMRELLKGNTDSVQFASLAQERGNPKVFYAGSWSNDAAGGAVYKTSDGGKKWAPSGRGLPAERVSMLRAGAPGTVFALVDDNGLFRTTDGGGSWSPAGSGLPEATPREVAVNPKDPTQLFAATEEGLYRSTDAATSWSRVTDGLEGDDVEAVAVDPSSGDVYAGTFYGVFRSSDGGATWTAFGEGLPNTDVRALVVAGPRLWAGTAGGSVWSSELP